MVVDMETVAKWIPAVKPAPKKKPNLRNPSKAGTDFELFGDIARREFPGLFLSNLKRKAV